MGLFNQLIINGLISGSIYALIAVGFSMIYRVNKIMHFAHGAVAMIAGYLLFSFFTILNINFLISIILSLILTGAIGVLLYWGVYYPLEKKKASNVISLIVSMALLIVLQNAIQAIYGAEIKSIQYISVDKGFQFLGGIITPVQIFIILTSLFFFFLLYFIINKTSIGRDIRAFSNNNDLAQIVGINRAKISTLVFFLASVIAGIGGILIALDQNIQPLMGTTLIIKAFTGAVIGGLANIPASILGSYILGLVENIGIFWISSAYKDAIAFILLFLFLLFKPEGLFRSRRRIA